MRVKELMAKLSKYDPETNVSLLDNGVWQSEPALIEYPPGWKSRDLCLVAKDQLTSRGMLKRRSPRRAKSG